MPCSAVTLSIATVAAIASAALMAIAFSTDNWIFVEVKRKTIQQFVEQNTAVDPQILESLNRTYYFFTRSRGLFRICFPEERPPVELYLSPVETYCKNVNLFTPEEYEESNGISDEATTRLHLARSCIALFLLAFLSLFMAFWTGVVGCWKRSPRNITATSLLMLATSLLSAGAMGLWHGVEFYENEKVVGKEFYQQWPAVLQDNTIVWYDWSYIIAWCSVGLALLSAVLFSSGAICLRGEREQEEAENMQYIMPTYPQKQQFAYAGFPSQAQPAPYSY